MYLYRELRAVQIKLRRKKKVGRLWAGETIRLLGSCQIETSWATQTIQHTDTCRFIGTSQGLQLEREVLGQPRQRQEDARGFNKLPRSHYQFPWLLVLKIRRRRAPSPVPPNPLSPFKTQPAHVPLRWSLPAIFLCLINTLIKANSV